jgi:histidine triad (HIT) family protein
MECPFCGIVAGEISSTFLFQDEQVVAFRDINPQAPQHILVVPRTHISSLNDLKAEDEGLISRLVMVAIDLAHQEGIAEKGYRLTINCGREGGQAVPHLHLHLLGGRRLDGRLG